MPEIDEDWEEWDPEEPFWVHASAGSLAGMMEHTLIFPVDTVKTWMQVNRGQNSLTNSLRRVRAVTHGPSGVLRMWRGMPITMAACGPAHAAYFSVYEAIKKAFRVGEPGHHPIGAAAAGAAATTLHDCVMTPFDVMKQRLQLGYYQGIGDCFKRMMSEEGVAAFYRSFPTTLGMNIPYAATMVATNESIKEFLNPTSAHDMATYFTAGAVSGAVAAAVTNPLDVIKTRLQTQTLSMQNLQTGKVEVSKPFTAKPQMAAYGTHARAEVLYTGFLDATRKIYQGEGLKGFARGLRPRLLLHTPSVAISWGTYEFVKHSLLGDRE